MSDTSETTPVWRQALNDSNHPLYSAAWTIFSSDMNLDAADKRLADHKDRIIPFLMDILDTPALLDDTALGSGYAPINAVSLLGRWKVIEAVPRLLTIVEKQDFEDLIWIGPRRRWNRWDRKSSIQFCRLPRRPPIRICAEPSPVS
jgi:hypothetical protein